MRRTRKTLLVVGGCFLVFASAPVIRRIDAQIFAMKAANLLGEQLVRDSLCGPVLAGRRGAICGLPSDTTLEAAAEFVSAASHRAARHEPAALRTLAAIDLVWRDASGKSVDRAISSLRNLRAQGYRPAHTLVDLAAAHTLRGDQTGSLLDYAEAVEAATAALRIDASNTQAAGNLSIALQRMHIHHEPTGTRAGDSESGLYAALDRHLPLWGRSILSGSENAVQQLDSVRRVVPAVRDRTLRIVLMALDNESGERLRLARAFEAYGQGRAAYFASQYADALGSFERAAASADEPLASWAAAFRAACLVYVNRSAEGEAALRALALSVDPVRYPSLAGRVQWMLGTTLLRSGRLEPALEAYRRAGPMFRMAGEVEHAGAVRYLESETLFALGDHARAYETSLAAMQMLAPYRGSQWLHNLLLVTAQRLAALGLTDAAIAVQTAGIETARSSSRLSSQAESLLGRAALQSNVRGAGPEHADRAEADVVMASRIIEAMPAGIIRKWLVADMQLVESGIQRARGKAPIIPPLDSAVRIAREAGNVSRLVRALAARAGAHAMHGNTRLSVLDLDEAAGALEKQRSNTHRAELRASLANASASVFDQLIHLNMRHGDAEAALEVVRRSRGSTSPQVPSDHAVLTAAMVNDTVMLWVEHAGKLHFHRSAGDRRTAQERIHRAIARLEFRDDRAIDDLTALYDILIDPIASAIAEAETIVVDVDGELSGVPFAALYDARRKRYLIETHAVVMRLPTTSQPRQRDRAHSNVLIVADPAFDERALPMLERLPGAAREAEQVAALHGNTVLLDGTVAGRAALLRELPHAHVLHFAGHALFDARNPDQSQLVLAADGDRSTGISAADLRAMDLTNLDLAVLSACRSVRTADGRSGFGSLAGAFLDAGAGGVIGSFWRVDDLFTSQLMVIVHRKYAMDNDAPAALREAQLAMLRAADPVSRSPASWAGFVFASR